MDKKIILVEDEAIIALHEKITIEKAGYTVIHSLTGEDAIEKVRENEDIALILMDIDLGYGMDGTEAAEIILSFRELPIVFLTSHSEKVMVDKVKNITKYGYVIKATGQFVLLETINMALELFRAHSELKKHEIEYREIVDGVDSAILKFDEDGRIIFFNKGAERIFGFEAAEVLGKLSVQTINPVSDSCGINHEEMMRGIFQNPEDYTINENENITKDGRLLWMRWFNKAVFDHNGQQLYVLGIGTDITQSRIDFKNIEKSKNLFESAFLNSPVMMSITRLSDGRYLEINDEFIRQTGFSRDECIGRTSSEVGVISAAVRTKKISELKEGQEIIKLPLRVHRRSGGDIDCDLTGVIIDIDDEKYLLSIAFVS